MHYWLAPESPRRTGFVKRFAAPYWTVDFPRPMMAAACTSASGSLRVDAIFYRQNDLAGLIWASEDRHDHPLLRYETSRDYRRCSLGFRWQSAGVKALDAPFGPTLTIEGRDVDGAARIWLVRLWNYAVGTPEDAQVRLDFGDLREGFGPGGAPVFTGDIDRLFISLVAPDYTGTDAPLAEPAEGWVEIGDIVCDGSGSVLALGDVIVPEHRLRIATGYDDLYHLTPERVMRNILALGYRGVVNHYVGMSHYFRLGNDGLVDRAVPLNTPCAAWCRDFASMLVSRGYQLIWSVSYELLDQHCPEDWKQRTATGDPALTGWSPPSALLSPANDAAMNYLCGVATAFAALGAEEGLATRFQIGEPWWWVTADHRPCLYDAAAVARFAPVPIEDVRADLTPAQKATLDAAGAVLAESTAGLAAAVRDTVGEAELLLLAYLPTVLDSAAPEMRRANLPPGWSAPAFDRLQFEDYDWAALGSHGATTAALAEATARLGYPLDAQHYFAGFVLAADQADRWPAIAAAAERAFARGTSEVFVWALPQVLRDGFTWFETMIDEEDQVDAFADELFPLAIGHEASVEPAFSTAIVETAGGAEQRNADWADARLRFDAGPGVRGETELHDLLAFFRARRGAAQAFRFRDPFDNSSAGMSGAPDAADQVLGLGDGARTDFALVKHYGGQMRHITRPVAGSVRVSVDGVERVGGWTLGAGGTVSFAAPPAPGASVRAGFRFDVPVRFAEDRLTVSRATFLAGEAASVPMIEVREA